MNPKMLKAIGAVIFVVGLTYASWFASYVPAPEEGQELPTGLARVSLWWGQVGTRFIGGLLFMVVGGVLARFADKKTRDAKADGKEEGDGSDPATGLAEILTALRALPIEELEKNPKTLADAIDEILTEQIPAFLDKRQELITNLGLERFEIGRASCRERV